MKISRLVILPLVIILIVAAASALAFPGAVRGQMTIPTRTPVPPDNPDPPPDPTDDSGGGGGNDGGSQPNPQDTAVPTNTPLPATPAPPATNTPSTASPVPTAIDIPTIGEATPTDDGLGAATAEGGALINQLDQLDKLAPGSTPVEFPLLAAAYPTAEPCGEPPTFTTLTTVNVYEGPGSDYPVRDTLAANEVRPIVGRAVYATWWLIQLDGKYQQGWISDKAGTVHGYTANVPIIEAPSINGALPTSGAEEWQPTPAPVCTPTVTPTSDSAPVSGAIIDYDSASSEKVNTTEDLNAASDQRSQMAEGAAPLELEVPATTPTPNLLPIAGLVLVIAAIFVALFLRRSPGGGDTSS